MPIICSRCDTDPTPPSGGAVAKGVDITINPAINEQAIVFVPDIDITLTSAVSVWLTPNNDFDLDDLDNIDLVTEIVDGGFNLMLLTNGPLVGTYKLFYTVYTT